MSDIVIRSELIDGETNWYWPATDNGAWDGPLEDWQEHKVKYFEKVRQFDTVVTAGACCGMYARFYSKKFKRVYAFEPSYLSFICMTLNCPQNNVLKFNCALGDKAVVMPFDDSDHDNVGVHKFDTTGTSFAQVLTLDDFSLENLDLLQLDAEGFEFAILKGAVKTIEKHKPVIVVERNVMYNECREWLVQHDYVPYCTSGHADTVYIHQDHV